MKLYDRRPRSSTRPAPVLLSLILKPDGAYVKSCRAFIVFPTVSDIAFNKPNPSQSSCILSPPAVLPIQLASPFFLYCHQVCAPLSVTVGILLSSNGGNSQLIIVLGGMLDGGAGLGLA